jgi:hypothetical protein
MVKTNQLRPEEGSLYYHCDKLSLEHKADVVEALLTNLRASKNTMMQRMLLAIENLCTEYCDLLMKDHNRAKPLYAVFGAGKRLTRYVPMDIHIPTAVEIEGDTETLSFDMHYSVAANYVQHFAENMTRERE